MAPGQNKANYKTYEAQARMVRAIVAAHPHVKWNYKDIVACYGSDMTEHALNHRFRRLRAQSFIVQEGRRQGFDIKDLPVSEDLPATLEAIDKQNIAKYFGQSSSEGIQFQFRSIKKDADTLRQVQADGGDVANCLFPNNTPRLYPSAVSSKKISSKQMTRFYPTAISPSELATDQAEGSQPSTGRKRGRFLTQKRPSSLGDEDEDDREADGHVGDDFDGDGYGPDDAWGGHEQTPTKRPRQGQVTDQQRGPSSRRAAVRASATIADAAARLQEIESSPERQPLASNVSQTLPESCVVVLDDYHPQTSSKSQNGNSVPKENPSPFMGCSSGGRASLYDKKKENATPGATQEDAYDDGEI